MQVRKYKEEGGTGLKVKHIPAGPRGLERAKVQENGRPDGAEGLGNPQEPHVLWIPQRAKSVVDPQRHHKACGGEALANQNVILMEKGLIPMRSCIGCALRISEGTIFFSPSCTVHNLQNHWYWVPGYWVQATQAPSFLASRSPFSMRRTGASTTPVVAPLLLLTGL